MNITQAISTATVENVEVPRTTYFVSLTLYHTACGR